MPQLKWKRDLWLWYRRPRRKGAKVHSKQLEFRFPRSQGIDVELKPPFQSHQRQE